MAMALFVTPLDFGCVTIGNATCAVATMCVPVQTVAYRLSSTLLLQFMLASSHKYYPPYTGPKLHWI